MPETAPRTRREATAADDLPGPVFSEQGQRELHCEEECLKASRGNRSPCEDGQPVKSGRVLGGAAV